MVTKCAEGTITCPIIYPYIYGRWQQGSHRRDDGFSDGQCGDEILGTRAGASASTSHSGRREVPPPPRPKMEEIDTLI